MNLYIDIETIPCQDVAQREYLVENVKPAKNLRDPGKIADDIERKAASVVSESGLSGDFGEVWCICWAVGDESVQTLTRDNLDNSYGEGLLLAEWIDQMDAICKRKDGGYVNPVWIGHNVADFDIRFLWKRIKVHNLEMAHRHLIPVNSPPWGDRIFDTMKEWEGLKNRISLDRLCHALKLPTPKTDLDGSKVWDAVQQGRYKEVAEYCARDVEAVREAHRRMTA